MGNASQSDGSRFTVDLGSIKLPAIMEKQVETDIRAVVLRALSDVDVAAVRRLGSSIFDVFPGRTLGLWLDPDAEFPQPGGPLSPVDHTLIVREIMKHPFHVLRYLDPKSRTDRPSGEEVLESALQVEQIDSYTKERIRKVLDFLPQLEEAKKSAPRSLLQEVRNLERKLAQHPRFEEKLRLLRDLSMRSDQKEVALGMELTAQILEDGASSIYSPDFSFYRTLSEGRVARAATESNPILEDMANGDAVGGVLGAGLGSVVPAIGTAAGGVTVGVGASVGVALGHALNWLFG